MKYMSPYGFLQGPVSENAHHMCKSQGGLTANVKLHFLKADSQPT